MEKMEKKTEERAMFFQKWHFLLFLGSDFTKIEFCTPFSNVFYERFLTPFQLKNSWYPVF